jgi:hypothetical protein
MTDLPARQPGHVVEAIKNWRPDETCLGAGDEHVALAVRCFAAAGLSNTAISRRIWRQAFGALTVGGITEASR